MRTTPDVIESLAHDFNWAENVVGDFGDPLKREALVQANRMAHFMLAQRGRTIVERLLNRLHEKDAVDDMMIKADNAEDSVRLHFDPKVVGELAKALGSFSEQAYRAIGDTEAAGTEPKDKRGGAGDMLELTKRLQALTSAGGTDRTLATAVAVKPA